jgi:hypothetical protein
MTVKNNKFFIDLFLNGLKNYFCLFKLPQAPTIIETQRNLNKQDLTPKKQHFKERSFSKR